VPQWKRKETCALLAAEQWKGRCALQTEQQQGRDVPPLQAANARVGRRLAGRADEEGTLQCSADRPSAFLPAFFCPRAHSPLSLRASPPYRPNSHAQLWRLVTTFLFFGGPSFSWLITMMML